MKPLRTQTSQASISVDKLKQSKRKSLIVLSFFARPLLSHRRPHLRCCWWRRNSKRENQPLLRMSLSMCEHGRNKRKSTTNAKVHALEKYGSQLSRGTRWMHPNTHTHTQPPAPFRRSLVSTVTEDKKRGLATAGLWHRRGREEESERVFRCTDRTEGEGEWETAEAAVKQCICAVV